MKKYVIFTKDIWNKNDIFISKVEKYINDTFYFYDFIYIKNNNIKKNNANNLHHYQLCDTKILYETDNEKDAIKRLKFLIEINNYNI